MSLLGSVRDLLTARRGVDGIVAFRQRNATQRAALAEEKAALFRAPAPYAERVANAERLAEAEAAKVAADLGTAVRIALSGRMEEDGTLRPPELPHAATLQILGIDPGMLRLFMAFDSKAGARLLMRIDAAAPPGLDGPPMASRPSRLLEILAEEAALVAQDTALVDEAAAAGVVLELLPAERAARSRQERAAEIHSLNHRATERAHRQMHARETEMAQRREAFARLTEANEARAAAEQQTSAAQEPQP